VVTAVDWSFDGEDRRFTVDPTHRRRVSITSTVTRLEVRQVLDNYWSVPAAAAAAADRPVLPVMQMPA